jgi:hypothetical protein
VVYSQVGSAAQDDNLLNRLDALPAPLMTGLLALVSGLILLLLFTDRRSGIPKGIHQGTALPLLAVTALWLPLAGAVLLTCFAAYHFEVLAHHCPWCLFLPEHRLVGYPLLGAFLVMGMEAPVPWLARRLARGYPDCAPAVARRIERVRIRMALALAVYWLVGGMPALIWRLRYGVWMG